MEKRYLQRMENDEYPNMTIYRHPNGAVKIAHFSLAFGEPSEVLEIILNKSDGFFETSRVMLPDEAIEFAHELIRRAKIAKRLRREWKMGKKVKPLPTDAFKSGKPPK